MRDRRAQTSEPSIFSLLAPAIGKPYGSVGLHPTLPVNISFFKVTLEEWLVR